MTVSPHDLTYKRAGRECVFRNQHLRLILESLSGPKRATVKGIFYNNPIRQIGGQNRKSFIGSQTCFKVFGRARNQDGPNRIQERLRTVFVARLLVMESGFRKANGAITEHIGAKKSEQDSTDNSLSSYGETSRYQDEINPTKKHPFQDALARKHGPEISVILREVKPLNHQCQPWNHWRKMSDSVRD